MNKLYGIKTSYSDYKIIEFEIIKETSKQYKANEITNDYWGYKFTINKNKMENDSFIFETTLEKAQLKRKELIQTVIQINKSRIEECKERITILEKLLLE